MKIHCINLVLIILGVIIPVETLAKERQLIQVDRVCGFWPDYRPPPDARILSRLTHLSFFSLGVLPDGNLDSSWFQPKRVLQLDSALKKHQVKKLFSIGGLGRSQNFSEMSANSEARALFIQNLVLFARRYQMDGVNLDWQGSMTKEDRKNYTLLFKELRPVFTKEKLLVTADFDGWYPIDSELKPEYFDWIHILSHAQFKHCSAQLCQSGQNGDFEDMKIHVNNWLKLGWPAAKIGVSIPLFAMSEKLSMDQPVQAMMLRDIANYQGENPHKDLYHNTPEVALEKMLWLKERGLNIMIWDPWGDREDQYSILNLIRER